MPRRKTGKGCRILAWLSRRADCSEGRFLQLGNSLLLSAKDEAGREANTFLKLTAGARILYLAMAMEAGGKREFQFTKGCAANKYGIPSSSFRRGVDELSQAGFITISSGQLTREPNIYRFSFGWKGIQEDHE